MTGSLFLLIFLLLFFRLTEAVGETAEESFATATAEEATATTETIITTTATTETWIVYYYGTGAFVSFCLMIPSILFTVLLFHLPTPTMRKRQSRAHICYSQINNNSSNNKNNNNNIIVSSINDDDDNNKNNIERNSNKNNDREFIEIITGPDSVDGSTEEETHRIASISSVIVRDKKIVDDDENDNHGCLQRNLSSPVVATKEIDVPNDDPENLAHSYDNGNDTIAGGAARNKSRSCSSITMKTTTTTTSETGSSQEALSTSSSSTTTVSPSNSNNNNNKEKRKYCRCKVWRFRCRFDCCRCCRHCSTFRSDTSNQSRSRYSCSIRNSRLSTSAATHFHPYHYYYKYYFYVSTVFVLQLCLVLALVGSTFLAMFNKERLFLLPFVLLSQQPQGFDGESGVDEAATTTTMVIQNVSLAWGEWEESTCGYDFCIQTYTSLWVELHLQWACGSSSRRSSTTTAAETTKTLLTTANKNEEDELQNDTDNGIWWCSAIVVDDACSRPKICFVGHCSLQQLQTAQDAVLECLSFRQHHQNQEQQDSGSINSSDTPPLAAMAQTSTLNGQVRGPLSVTLSLPLLLMTQEEGEMDSSGSATTTSTTRVFGRYRPGTGASSNNNGVDKDGNTTGGATDDDDGMMLMITGKEPYTSHYSFDHHDKSDNEYGNINDGNNSFYDYFGTCTSSCRVLKRLDLERIDSYYRRGMILTVVGWGGICFVLCALQLAVVVGTRCCFCCCCCCHSNNQQQQLTQQQQQQQSPQELGTQSSGKIQPAPLPPPSIYDLEHVVVAGDVPFDSWLDPILSRPVQWLTKLILLATNTIVMGYGDAYEYEDYDIDAGCQQPQQEQIKQQQPEFKEAHFQTVGCRSIISKDNRATNAASATGLFALESTNHHGPLGIGMYGVDPLTSTTNNNEMCR